MLFNKVALRTRKAINDMFNIVEVPFEKLLNFDVCVVWWRSDGPIKSQEYKSFEILCGHYEDILIYDRISPLNQRPGSPFILTAVYGEKWVR